MLALLKSAAGAGTERAFGQLVGQHVVLDEPGAAVGDEAVECLQRGGDVVGGINRLADVVQQGGGQELFVVGQLIAGVVERYKSALEQRNMSALKAVWPGLSGAQQAAIEGDFANARSIEVDLSSPKITVSGSTATVVTRRQYQLRTRDGQQLRSESITTITLRQTGGAWVIESVRYQPVR